jgi:hypothetical protein
MKQMIFSAFMLFAVAAWAQAPAKEAAKPEPMKEAAKPQAEPKQEPPKQAAATTRKGPRRWNEDARHCLEKASNTEIIKCAEEYL